MTPVTQIIDQNKLKTGHALTFSLLIIAFVLDLWPLVTFVAIAQILGAFALPFAPFRLIYEYLVLGKIVKQPNPQPDNADPHRFALLVGSVFNFSATVLLIQGASAAGWTLVWIVIVLANLNFWVSFCLGCWFYYQLNRLGVPGFTQSPIKE